MLYFLISLIAVSAIVIIALEIDKKKKEYFIRRKGTRYYLYKHTENGHISQVEDYVAKSNGGVYYDFYGVHFMYKDIEMAKESLAWHKRGYLKYKGYKITHVLKDCELAFRFKGEAFRCDYYMVFPSVELCKQAIEELIERETQEKVQYRKENETIYL